MSKDTAKALKAKGEQQKAAMGPEMEAQAEKLRVADQANAAAQDALKVAQGNADAASTSASAEKASMDALLTKSSKLDQAIRDADNAADIWEAIEHLEAGEVAREVIAPLEMQAGTLEGQAQAVIEAAPVVAPAPEAHPVVDALSPQ